MQFNKTIILLFIIGALGMASCKKDNTDSAGGTFTFKSTTYKVSFANYVLGSFTAYTGTNIPTAALTFTFYDSTSNATAAAIRAGGGTVPPLPQKTTPKPGTFRVTNVSNPRPDSGYVFVQLSDTSIRRYFNGQPGQSYVVNVTRTADGKTNIEVPGVMFRSANDSALLTGSLKQTP